MPGLPPKSAPLSVNRPVTPSNKALNSTNAVSPLEKGIAQAHYQCSLVVARITLLVVLVVDVDDNCVKGFLWWMLKEWYGSVEPCRKLGLSQIQIVG